MKSFINPTESAHTNTTGRGGKRSERKKSGGVTHSKRGRRDALKSSSFPRTI